ncbi:procathepsin L-like [Haliotis cracherodii]|uniref:procathepsin L-like n=1 Tax=Haliotis cracherodii TaxID=6455 RepID=UPI0039E97AA2
MLRFVVFAAVVVAALAMPPMEWELFKKTHNKQYDFSEEMFRRSIYEHNVMVIKTHNAKYDQGKQTFKLGVNQFADWTTGEFAYYMNGYRMSNFTRHSSVVHRARDVELPTMVDWRQEGYVTPVKNQKQCGSCWSFSATGSLEGQHFKSTGKLVSLSEQNLMDCSKPEGNMGCQGGLMDQAFEYIKLNNGVDTEESYPYKAKNGKCHFKRENVGATDTGFVDVEKDNEMALQNAAATIGPISVAIDASKQSFQLYESGVYSDPECSSTQLDHGVLVVGYGTDMDKDYWLVKNSWGESWGMEGYIKMARNMNNMCGIATSASYPTV